MKIACYEFSPRLWLTGLTIVLLVILLRLGFWQLDRAEEKRQIISQQQALFDKGPLLIDRLINKDEIADYQPVKFSGHYISSKVIFLDNKPHNGVHGYQVITPFKITGVEEPVLVNRGWIAMPVHRESLPDVATSTELTTISGMAKIPTAFFTLGEQINEDNRWPWRIQWLELSSIEKQLGMKLQPFIVLQDKVTGQLVQDWQIVVSPPEKNISYAVQWFALATALLIIFIVVNTKKRSD